MRFSVERLYSWPSSCIALQPITFKRFAGCRVKSGLPLRGLVPQVLTYLRLPKVCTLCIDRLTLLTLGASK